MAGETFVGNVGEVGLAGASKGVALTNTAAFTGLSEGTHLITLTPRNFASGAVVARYKINPYLLIFKTTDALIEATNLTNYSREAQDDDTGTDVVLSSMNTAANGHFLFVGSDIQFRGVFCDIDSPNDQSSIITVRYWDGSAWSDTGDDDGTIDTGKSLGLDGLISWTVPSDWTTTSLMNASYTLTDGTGTATGSPIILVPGTNAIDVTGAGTFTIVLPTGATGFAESDGATVTDSPKALVAGSQVITVTGTGNINVIISKLPPHSLHMDDPDIYWTRWEWSQTLGSATTLNSMLSANRLTNYAEILSGQRAETTVTMGIGGIACIEALTDAGTANLVINVATRSGSRRFA